MSPLTVAFLTALDILHSGSSQEENSAFVRPIVLNRFIHSVESLFVLCFSYYLIQLSTPPPFFFPTVSGERREGFASLQPAAP